MNATHTPHRFDWPCEYACLYVVTHRDGDRSICAYCDDCADLARINWTGETKAIELWDIGGPLSGGELAANDAIGDGRESDQAR